VSKVPPGTLYVCATPIGNLSDASPRLIETLGAVDVIYAEDTRRTAKLLNHFDIATRSRSLFAGNEAARSSDLVADLLAGSDVALVSDAGMPGVSDPGALAVSRARAAGARVSVIPGPSAVTMSVALAGFGEDRFVFEGFLPRKGKDRARRLDLLADEERPVVFFVSPYRLLADLEALKEVVGEDRLVSINRELTKVHEESWLGSIEEAIELWGVREPKGEFTIVVGPGPAKVADIDSALSTARGLVDSGESVSEAARVVAGVTGLSRRRIYEQLLSSQEDS
jgi:16S rRNA (cytidine1402-2'-O)-methyltransferase